jgi:hypothetical protein
VQPKKNTVLRLNERNKTMKKNMKKIEKEEFINAIITGNTDIILQGIEEGIDLSIVSEEQEDGCLAPIESASYADNYGVLYIFWKYDVLATTEYIEAIFKKFKNGILPDELYANDKLEQMKRLNKVKLDLSSNFSASKLILKKIKFIVDENGSEIIVTFKPFRLIDEIFERTIEFTTNNILTITPNSELTFSKEGEDMNGSFYFDNVHNPVDLKRIKFGNQVGKKIEVELELFFDFEYERTPLKNESIILHSKI